MNDNDLKNLFRENLPEAPRNGWFVRKVMNRLPDKRVERKSGQWIEWVAYAIAAILTLYFGISVGVGIYSSGCVTVGDIVTLVVLGVIIVMAVMSYFVPVVRDWLRDS